MTSPSILDPLAERIEQLIEQHEALEAQNRLLTQEVHALRKDRDSLKSRLKAARARIDELIELLPANQERP